MLGRQGNPDASRSSVRSGEGRIQMCGLKDDGSTGAMMKPDGHEMLTVAVDAQMLPRARERADGSL